MNRTVGANAHILKLFFMRFAHILKLFVLKQSFSQII